MVAMRRMTRMHESVGVFLVGQKVRSTVGVQQKKA